jgi:hypothetical protein
MKLKNIIIEAEAELARRLAQYNLTESEYTEYVQEYNDYLSKTYTIPDDDQLDCMCRLSRD